jgi:hypothetical protein
MPMFLLVGGLSKTCRQKRNNSHAQKVPERMLPSISFHRKEWKTNGSGGHSCQISKNPSYL